MSHSMQKKVVMAKSMKEVYGMVTKDPGDMAYDVDYLYEPPACLLPLIKKNLFGKYDDTVKAN